MNETKILLNAYYELLYELIEAKKDVLTAKIEKLLKNEIAKAGLTGLDDKKFKAYYDTCLAFVAERLEMYNPVGIQFIFDHLKNKQAFELEYQFDNYDSQAEFAALLAEVQKRAIPGLSEQKIYQLAKELIADFGAFPDKSIISAYKTKPALNKLPDYIVACAIEEVIR